MKIILIALGYLKWHYGKAVYSLSGIWRNFISFTYNYFSIKLLFKNFFDPWKRMTDKYPTGFNLKLYFYAFLTNLIIRIVGMIMRTVLILAGLTCCILLVIFYPIVLIIWLLLPIITIFLLEKGVALIIK